MGKSHEDEVKEKDHKLLNWLKEECKDWKTFAIFLIVIIIMYMPVWGGYLLYYIFKWKIALTTASVVMAFWLGPFTPFFPLAITITLFIKKIMQISKKRKKDI